VANPIPAGEALASFLGPSTEDPEQFLAALLIDHALPVVKNVVARRLATSPADVREDVAGEALAALVARLRVLRRDPSAGTAIADFSAYAAGVAGNAVHQYLSARRPERARLRRRIRMACSTDVRFRIWETGMGFWLCGEVGWRTDDRASAAAIETCRKELASSTLPKSLPDLLERIFQEVSIPIELNDLLFLCCGLLGIADEVHELEAVAERIADPNAQAAQAAQSQAWLAGMWKEIRELPDRQRLALLLNLRTPGGAAIGLFEDLGIAGFGELALVLTMSALELAEIWDRLPLNDKEISERMGVERQQVINLRSAARERLARRMNALPILWKTAPH
jgi:RNA polymerase sigma factor (sigma-70 family)